MSDFGGRRWEGDVRGDVPRRARALEVTATWVAMVALFILWPRAATLEALAVQMGVMVAGIVVVAVLSSLALEHRLPVLWQKSAPVGARDFLVVGTVGTAVFVALLVGLAVTGLLGSAPWAPFLGMGYAMTLFRILARW